MNQWEGTIISSTSAKIQTFLGLSNSIHDRDIWQQISSKYLPYLFDPLRPIHSHTTSTFSQPKPNPITSINQPPSHNQRLSKRLPRRINPRRNNLMGLDPAARQSDPPPAAAGAVRSTGTFASGERSSPRSNGACISCRGTGGRSRGGGNRVSGIFIRSVYA